MRGTYIGDKKMLIETLYGGKLIVPSDDLSITPDLVLQGAIEIPLTKYLINHLKPGSIVVDIGANVGYFSVLLGMIVGPIGRVYVYEANPYLFTFLMDNLSINYLHDRVITNQKAVYSISAGLTFYTTKRYMGNSSIYKHDANYFKNYVDELEKIEVQAITLDDELKNEISIDLLKIDIEGGELHAFLGFKNLYQSNIIKTVIFELNKNMLKDDWETFIKLLRNYRDDYNKRFYTLTDQGYEEEIDFEVLVKNGSYPFIVIK